MAWFNVDGSCILLALSWASDVPLAVTSVFSYALLPAARRCVRRAASDVFSNPCTYLHISVSFCARPGFTNVPEWWNTHTRLTALCPGLPGWAGTRKVKPIWILLKQETVKVMSVQILFEESGISCGTDCFWKTPPVCRAADAECSLTRLSVGVCCDIVIATNWS